MINNILDDEKKRRYLTDNLLLENLLKTKRIDRRNDRRNDSIVQNITKLDPNKELDDEKKRSYLTDNLLLENLLKTNRNDSIVQIITKLNPNKELDYELKKKILLNPYFFNMLIQLNIPSTILKIINNLDITNLNEQKLKKEFFKNNLESICTSLDSYDALNIIKGLNTKHSTDAEIKKMIYMEKPYKLSIIKIQDPTITYMYLDSNDPVDREIKKSFFFDDDNLSIIIENINTGVLFDALGRYNEQKFDIEIKHHLFLNDKILKTVLERLSPSLIPYLIECIKLNPQSNKPIKEKIFLEDEFFQIIAEKAKKVEIIDIYKRKKSHRGPIYEINRSFEDTLDKIIKSFGDTIDEIDQSFINKLKLDPERFLLLIQRYGIKKALEELNKLNPEKKAKAILKKEMYLKLFSPENKLNKNPKDLIYAIDLLNTNNAVDAEIKSILLLNNKYIDYILMNLGSSIIINLDSLNPIDKIIKTKFFLNKNNFEKLKSAISPTDFLNMISRKTVENSFDNTIKRRIILDNRVLNNVFNTITTPELEMLWNLLDNDKNLNNKLKKKIFSDNKYKQIIINKMNQKLFIELVKSLNYSSDEHEKDFLNMILEEKNFKYLNNTFNILNILEENIHENNCLELVKIILMNEVNFSIAIENCNVYELMMALNQKEGNSNLIELLKEYIFFNSNNNKFLDYEIAENIVFKFMDPSNPKDINIIDKILFNPNTDKRILDFFAIYLIIFVFHAEDKPIDLLRKIKYSLYTDSSYLKRILSLATIKNISHALDKFEPKIENDFEFLYFLISNKNFNKNIKECDSSDLSRIVAKLKKLDKNNENERSIYNTLKTELESSGIFDYIKTPMTKTIDTPIGHQKVFLYNRCIIMINQTGEQFIVNVSGGVPEVQPTNIEIIKKYSWLHHAPSIANCLLSWGASESDISPISEDSDDLSFYASKKGIITIQIEGENVNLFVPKEITAEQSKTFDDDLAIIKNQEEQTDTKMNFQRIVLHNKQLIIRPNKNEPEEYKPFFVEEIKNILKSLGIIAEEIVKKDSLSVPNLEFERGNNVIDLEDKHKKKI